MDQIAALVKQAEELLVGITILLDSLHRDLERVESQKANGLLPEHLEWLALRKKATTLAVSELMKAQEDFVLDLRVYQKSESPQEKPTQRLESAEEKIDLPAEVEPESNQPGGGSPACH